MALKELAETLKKISDDELVRFQGQHENNAAYRILAEHEFQRRERAEQHQLDLDLVFKQVRWMKFSAMLGIFGTVTGAIVGAVLTYWLQDKPSPKQLESPPRSSQRESVPSASVDRTEKDESVPSKTP
jgi:hypothetical protein